MPDEFDERPTPKDSTVTDIVNLPSLISNEFGISPSVAREQIALGMVMIDGEQWDGDRFDIPMTTLIGRVITVRGRSRSFRMVYEG